MNRLNTINRTKKLSLDRQVVRNLTPQSVDVAWGAETICTNVTHLASGCTSNVHADALGRVE